MLNITNIFHFFKIVILNCKYCRVVVVLENRVYVYNFADLRLIDAIDTIFNPKGICALSADPNLSVLATPDKTKGHVKVNVYERNNSFVILAH